MSGALIFRFIIFNIFSVLLLGCFETSVPKSFLSKNNSEQIAVSSFGYRGAVEKSIALKFNVEKNEISQITATVRLPENYKDSVKYKWMLGAGVTLTDGSLEQILKPTEDNQNLKIKILVRGFNSLPTKHVRFEIIGENSDRRIFADGIVSSNQENSFEAIVKNVEQYKKENPNEK